MFKRLHLISLFMTRRALVVQFKKKTLVTWKIFLGGAISLLTSDRRAAAILTCMFSYRKKHLHRQSKCSQTVLLYKAEMKIPDSVIVLKF